MTNDLEILGMSAVNALHTPNIPLRALLMLLAWEEQDIFSVILTVVSAIGVEIIFRWATED